MMKAYYTRTQRGFFVHYQVGQQFKVCNCGYSEKAAKRMVAEHNKMQEKKR